MNANNLTTTDKKNEIKSKTPQNNSNIYEFYINKLEYYSDVLSNVIVDLNNRVNYKYITNTESIICI